jgi:hypothetical protein
MMSDRPMGGGRPVGCPNPGAHAPQEPPRCRRRKQHSRQHIPKSLSQLMLAYGGAQQDTLEKLHCQVCEACFRPLAEDQCTNGCVTMLVAVP